MITIQNEQPKWSVRVVGEGTWLISPEGKEITHRWGEWDVEDFSELTQKERRIGSFTIRSD